MKKDSLKIKKVLIEAGFVALVILALVLMFSSRYGAIVSALFFGAVSLAACFAADNTGSKENDEDLWESEEHEKEDKLQFGKDDEEKRKSA